MLHFCEPCALCGSLPFPALGSSSRCLTRGPSLFCLCLGLGFLVPSPASCRHCVLSAPSVPVTSWFLSLASSLPQMSFFVLFVAVLSVLSLSTFVPCPFLSLFSWPTRLWPSRVVSSSFFLAPHLRGLGASEGFRPCLPSQWDGGRGREASQTPSSPPLPYPVPSDGTTCHHRTVSTAPGCLPHRRHQPQVRGQRQT